MVQTTNSKEAAKAVVGKHNPLVAGSNPAGPTFIVPLDIIAFPQFFSGFDGEFADFLN